MGTLKTGCYYYWGCYLDHGYRWREKNSYLNDKKSAILHLYCCTDILLH